MRASKLIATAFIFLAACSQHGSEQQLSPEEQATFLVDPVTATAEEGEANATFANISTSKLLNFTACLKDVAVQEPVTGAEFQVTGGDQPITLKSPVPDAKGCLYWSENFPFNSTKQETYFELTRSIEAISVHKGRATVKLAVNPWKKGGEAVLDLRYRSAPINTQAASAAGGLVIESVNAELEIVRSKDSAAEANLRLSFSPKIARIGIDGSKIVDGLTSGEFQVRSQIIALGPDGESPLTEVADFGRGTVNGGLVQVASRVKIFRKIPQEATIELSFEAVPVEAPAGLGSVKGRVPLGRLTNLSISKAAPLRPDAQVSFLAPAPGTKAEGGVFGFELGRARVTNVVVKGLDSTGKPNLLLVDFTVCPRNSISQEKILGLQFSASLDGKRFPGLKTDPEEGCLKWLGQPFEFDYHAKESFLKRTLTVQSENSFYGDSKVERVVYIDLWNYETPERIVTDEQYDGAPAPSAADMGTGSELILPNAYFNYMDRTFEIDDALLNLSTTRRYRFEIQPKIRRMSRDKGWLPTQGTGNGRYLVRMMLETADRDHPQVIDAKTFTAESRADVITSTVDFHVRDLRLVNVRTVLSIEVLPIDRSVSIRTRPYMGTFDMLGGFSVRLEPRMGKIEERMKEAERFSTPSKVTGLELYRQARQPTWIDADYMVAHKAGVGDLDALIAGASDKGLTALCSEFYDPDGWFSGYKSCVKDPKSHLTVVPARFVRQVRKSKIAQLPDTWDVGMSAGVNYSEFESDEVSDSYSSSTDLYSKISVGVPLGEVLGLNVGAGIGTSDSWRISKSHSKGKGKGKSRSGDQGKQLNVDQIAFKIDADIDRCVLVAAEGQKKVLMGCHSHPQTTSVTENYYFMYQPINSGAVMDTGAQLSERPFLALIRGQDRYQNFLRLLQDPEVTLNLSQNALPAPADVMREAEKRFDGYFPGLLTAQ